MLSPYLRLPLLALLLFVGSIGALQAQQASDPTAPRPEHNKTKDPEDHVTITTANPLVFMKNIGRDQRDIWTAPFRARVEDLKWIVPMVGLTAGAISADSELSSRVNQNGTIGKRAGTISNGGLAAALGGAGGLYLMGKWRSNDHQKETGLLAAEAGIDSFVVVEALKAVTQRQRPTDGSGQGKFWSSHSLSNSAFPSAHALVTWSVASVLAHEYPGVATQVLAYGLATGVSVARVYGKNHFPSDVIAGSAMGWMIGQHVYAAHHDRDLLGGSWGTFQRDPARDGLSSESQFSPYVPIDSWIYPAFDRLIALGMVNSGLQGLRPWTRAECARLLEDAHDEITDDDGSEASRLYQRLADEFAAELRGDERTYIGLDSVYARGANISGKPLTDGYHFGQTIVNDYGRPYQKGFNWLSGFSSSGSSGALGFYVRGEWEHAPSAPGVSRAVLDAIQVTDGKSFIPASPIQTFDKFRLLDSYLALNLHSWQLSFGKQSLWLGPTQDPFLWSNNAEPLWLFRVDQTIGKELPGFLKYLGTYRSEIWVGKLTGQHFVSTQDGKIAASIGRSLERQPMVNGLKINFRPTPNFEFGLGRTGLWGGPEFPITLGTTKRSFLSTGNAAGVGLDPGDRRSTFDFSYRIPGLRKWLTLYEDSFVEDEISPIGYPRRAAHNPGIYLSQFPGLHHLDFRGEAAYTNLPGLIQLPQGGFFYWNVRYVDGYTNKGNILGNGTVGRQGISLRAQSTYWFSSDKTVQVGYRSDISDPMFLQGGSLRDVFLRSEWSFHHNLAMSAFMQYEWWKFPLLSAANRTSNFTTSIQLTYWPHWRLKGASDDR